MTVKKERTKYLDTTNIVGTIYTKMNDVHEKDILNFYTKKLSLYKNYNKNAIEQKIKIERSIIEKKEDNTIIFFFNLNGVLRTKNSDDLKFNDEKTEICSFYEKYKYKTLNTILYAKIFINEERIKETAFYSENVREELKIYKEETIKKQNDFLKENENLFNNKYIYCNFSNLISKDNVFSKYLKHIKVTKKISILSYKNCIFNDFLVFLYSIKNITPVFNKKEYNLLKKKQKK